jgi:shikimate dehydrogenase
MIQIDAITRLYGLIGHPIVHSLSPLFQNRLLELHEINGVYMAFDISKEHLLSIRKTIQTLNIRGLNITVPHKVDMLSQVDQLDESALRVGAINTVLNNDGVLVGYNTDMLGFGAMLDQMHLNYVDTDVAVLGAGGAARAVLAAIDDRKFNTVTLYNRTLEKAEKLIEILKLNKAQAKPLFDYRANNNQLLINTTSVGLNKGESAVSIVAPFENMHVIDLIYNPAETELMKMAREHGIPAKNGMEMLLYQGVKSFEIWNDLTVDYSIVQGLLDEIKAVL